MKKLSMIAILVVIAGLMIPMSMAAADPNVLQGTVTDANGVTHEVGVTESGEITGLSSVDGDCIGSCLREGPISEFDSGCDVAQRCLTDCGLEVRAVIAKCGPN